MSKINHAAAWVSAVVYFLWGWLWYTIFGSQWMAFMGRTGATASPTSAVPYAIGFLMALVLAYGTSVALADSEQHSAAHGISFGVFMGVVFWLATLLTEYLFEGRPLGLWLINGFYPLIGFAIVGAIVGGWPRRAVSTS